MPPIVKNKVRGALDLIRLTKQYGTLLVMMPALWSLIVAAQGTPSVRMILIFIMGSFLMRSAGCVINDIADRKFDGLVERTRNRPLPSGRLSVMEALTLFGFLSVMALVLALQLNPLTRFLSIGGAALAVVYPFAKRISSMPQVVMGVAFGWGSIMAWAAVRNTIETPAILIFLASLFWATAYDTIYALMDRDDDRKIGLRSTAILFGRSTWIAVGAFYILASAFLIGLGLASDRGPIYYLFIGLAAFGLLAQCVGIRGPVDRPKAFMLFRSNVAVGFIILTGLVLDYHH